MVEEKQIEQEPMTSKERQKYALLAAVVVVGVAAMFTGFDPITILAGLGGLLTGVMIDPNA